jgi:hypothetical protein
VIPKHVLYDDEQMFIDKGTKIFNVEKDIFFKNSDSNWYFKSPGWSFLLSLSFGIFGKSDYVALYTAVVMGALIAFILFLILYTLTKSTKIACLTSLIYVLFPLNIFWSSTSDNTIPSTLFLSITLLFILMYLSEQNTNKKERMLWLVIFSLAFTSLFRSENYIFAAVFFMIYFYDKLLAFLAGKNGKKENLKAILPFLTYILLVCTDLIFQSRFSGTSCRYIEETKLNSFLSVVSNNTGYILFAVIILIVSIVGIISILKMDIKKAIIISAPLLCSLSIVFFFWTHYLFNFLPFSPDFFNLYNRFLLSAILFISIVFGIGLNVIDSIKGRLSKVIIFGIVFLLIAIDGTALYRNITYINNPALILEVSLPNHLAKDANEKDLIVSSCPGIFTTTSFRNVISTKEYFQQDRRKNEELLNESKFNRAYLIVDFCYYSKPFAYNQDEYLANLTEYKRYYLDNATFFSVYILK